MKVVIRTPSDTKKDIDYFKNRFEKKAVMK